MNKLSIFLVLLAGTGSMCSRIPAQQPPDLVQRDQSEILRKANRLQDLMTRLLKRYEKEGRNEQVELLRRGLKHLADTGILEETASVRNSLDTGKFADALRRQTEIVTDLEGLLDILLDRQSVENLQKEIEATENMLATASELLRRQEQLQQRTLKSGEGRVTPAEQEIADQLASLARRQRQEARENQRQAGLRLPTLEAALRRLKELLSEQEDLEAKTATRLAGQENKTLRKEMFRLGNLEQRQRDLNEQQRRSRDLHRLRSGSEELRAALNASDQDRVDRQSARLEARMQAAAGNVDQELAEEIRALAKKLSKLRAKGQSDERDAEILGLTKEIEDLTAKVGSRIDQQRQKDQKELAAEIDATAKEYRANGEKPEGKTKFAGTKALVGAIENLQSATDAEQQGDQERAMAATAQALRRLAEARRAMRRANPEAGERANGMASKADQIARDLRNSPAGDATAEDQAAKALDQAQQSLRGLASKIQDDQAGSQALQSEPVKQDLQDSRQNLEHARNLLQAVVEENRAGNSRSLQRASERQQQLARESQAASDAIDSAKQSGQLSDQQGQRAAEDLAKAQQAMTQAAKSLQQGLPSRASSQQEQAADSLEQARKSLQRNRPLTEEARQQLKQIAKNQEELRKEIIELAELAKERNNRQAEDALREASRAADQARQDLSNEDPAEAEQDQEQVKEKLTQAQEALQEERDRYMDLRQEELLFRIKDELKQFLEKQQPISLATDDAGRKLAEGRRLTRPVRRKLNQLGERELELADKLKFIKEALTEEDVVVYSYVLRANEQDLRSVSQRLSGSRPDPGEYTSLLQHDVENRTTKLIEALKRE